MSNPFTHRTERYYGSKINIHTISWKGHGEVDAREIQKWCRKNFGPSGYQEEINGSHWIDNTDLGEIMLCKDEFLTLFLLKWT
jgi:hypothetical protein